MPHHVCPLPRWRDLLRSHAEDGATLEAFCAASPENAGSSLLLALGCRQDVLDRSFRRGLVLCAAEDSAFTAVLFWQGRVLGVYRHYRDKRGVDGIAVDLKEFRLGWLPDEIVRGTGGAGSAFTALPPEAEGFPAICITGPAKTCFAGHGKLY